MVSNLQITWRISLFIIGVLSIARCGQCVFQPMAWKYAHATFYGDNSASATMGGACGYGNLFDNGYGTNTAALSSVLFNNGYACGRCYQIMCVDSKWCNCNGGGGYVTKSSATTSITVTATNSCPPNWYQDTNNGGWCNPPREHFDLAKPAFDKLAYYVGGIIPIKYRRVACQRSGGIRFSFQGNPYWLLVYVMNVGGAGDVSQMWVKGTQTDWISMSQNWGASFQVFSKLGGQALCFKLQSGTTGQIIILINVAPANWQTGNSYQATSNFT